MQDFLMMYFVIFFNSASVGYIMLRIPFCCYIFERGILLLDIIPESHISHWILFFFWDFNSRYARKNLYYSEISEVYWRGILFRHPAYFVFEGWVAVKDEKGEWGGFVGHFGWKLGMWQLFVKICQRGSKKTYWGNTFWGGDVGREIISK